MVIDGDGVLFGDAHLKASFKANQLPIAQAHYLRKYSYDTLKVEHHAHGAKTSDPVINTEKDELLILRYGHCTCLC